MVFIRVHSWLRSFFSVSLIGGFSESAGKSSLAASSSRRVRSAPLFFGVGTTPRHPCPSVDGFRWLVGIFFRKLLDHRGGGLWFIATTAEEEIPGIGSGETGRKGVRFHHSPNHNRLGIIMKTGAHEWGTRAPWAVGTCSCFSCAAAVPRAAESSLLTMENTDGAAKVAVRPSLFTLHTRNE